MESLDIKELNSDLTHYRLHCTNVQTVDKGKVKYTDHKIDKTTVSLIDLEELKENLVFIEEIYNHLIKNIPS